MQDHSQVDNQAEEHGCLSGRAEIKRQRKTGCNCSSQKCFKNIVAGFSLCIFSIHIIHDSQALPNLHKNRIFLCFPHRLFSSQVIEPPATPKLNGSGERGRHPVPVLEGRQQHQCGPAQESEGSRGSTFLLLRQTVLLVPRPLAEGVDVRGSEDKKHLCLFRRLFSCLFPTHFQPSSAGKTKHTQYAAKQWRSTPECLLMRSLNTA